jgi:hypothetical protein
VGTLREPLLILLFVLMVRFAERYTAAEPA